MSLMFKHSIDSVDGLTVRFRSIKIHPQAGVAWPWHHALLAIAWIAPMESNPLEVHFGDGLFNSELLREKHAEVFAEISSTRRGNKGWNFTVRFTDAKWIPSALAPGHAWESAA